MTPDDPAQERLILCITLPLSTAIILANLLIILGIASNRQLHNTPNYFFLSLLVADLCTGVALPFIPRMGLSRDLDFSACLLVHIFPNFLFLSYLFNLVMVHYERYLCIASPLHHSQFWVHRCFPLALLTVWAPPLLYASLPAFGWNNWVSASNATSSAGGGNGSAPSGLGEEGCSYRLVFPNTFIYLEVYGLLLPAILSIVGMTGRVLWIARRQVRDLCKLRRSVERAQAVTAEHRLNLRYAKCVAAVSLVFVACWVPYIVYVHVSVGLLRRGGAGGGPGGGASSTHIVLSCTGIGSMAIIPVVLGLANRQYTDPARRLLHTLRARWRRREPGDIAL
ncbi:G-protein coupled bile acid receptor 1-like [Anguilla rostrata]|uniref:G-protein coupled bile acid receptor 1-like n=1 Tax=Anguilla rostrata TaxID=7938 RepID=UPI0030D1930B